MLFWIEISRKYIFLWTNAWKLNFNEFFFSFLKTQSLISHLADPPGAARYLHKNLKYAEIQCLNQTFFYGNYLMLEAPKIFGSVNTWVFMIWYFYDFPWHSQQTAYLQRNIVLLLIHILIRIIAILLYITPLLGMFEVFSLYIFFSG